MITILQIAKAWGAREECDRISYSEFDRLGLPAMGGCENCHATVAAYNAYPSKSGYIRCSDCIGDRGFESVEEFGYWDDEHE